jgi:hypothetical protein
MGEVVRLIASSERERARLIREARAIYDSIFPPADPPGEHRDEASASHAASRAAACHGDGVILS